MGSEFSDADLAGEKYIDFFYLRRVFVTASAVLEGSVYPQNTLKRLAKLPRVMA
jgi:hypothetical protein